MIRVPISGAKYAIPLRVLVSAFLFAKGSIVVDAAGFAACMEPMVPPDWVIERVGENTMAAMMCGGCLGCCRPDGDLNECPAPRFVQVMQQFQDNLPIFCNDKCPKCCDHSTKVNATSTRYTVTSSRTSPPWLVDSVDEALTTTKHPGFLKCMNPMVPPDWVIDMIGEDRMYEMTCERACSGCCRLDGYMGAVQLHNLCKRQTGSRKCYQLSVRISAPNVARMVPTTKQHWFRQRGCVRTD